jgi:hypothetical protein
MAAPAPSAAAAARAATIIAVDRLCFMSFPVSSMLAVLVPGGA